MTTVMHLPLAENRDYPPHGGMDPAPEADTSEIEADQIYSQLLISMQQGRWPEAAEYLAALEGRHPGATELVNVRLSLALHLSAEESWSGKMRRVADGPALPMPLIRALVVANLVLYALIILMLFLSRGGLS